MENPSHAMEFANILHHLNYRWSAEALAISKGDRAPFELYQIYEPYKNFISLETLAQIDRLKDDAVKIRLKHSLIDHYLRQRLLPHETEMQCWMKGASAAVNGEKVYFKEIIPWCQKSSTYKKRQILHKETVPLCKFLMPFVLNSELLISRNFNCNLFRLEGQHQLGAGVDKRLLIHDFA